MIEGKHSLMSNKHEKQLEKIGFECDHHDLLWEQRCNELLEFKNQYGHCNVPQSNETNSLRAWLTKQINSYKLHLDGKPSYMTPNGIECFEKLGLDLGEL